jgi:transposase
MILRSISNTIFVHNVRFQELSDKQWEFISGYIPPSAYTGRPRYNDRTTINGILYVLTTGSGGWTYQKESGMAMGKM